MIKYYGYTIKFFTSFTASEILEESKSNQGDIISPQVQESMVHSKSGSISIQKDDSNSKKDSKSGSIFKCLSDGSSKKSKIMEKNADSIIDNERNDSTTKQKQHIPEPIEFKVEITLGIYAGFLQLFHLFH